MNHYAAKAPEYGLKKLNEFPLSLSKGDRYEIESKITKCFLAADLDSGKPQRGTLAEGEGSVQLTSPSRQLVL